MWPKSPPLGRHSWKIRTPQPNNFFRVHCRRLAAFFEPLNSSPPLLAPELRVSKSTCDAFAKPCAILLFWRENPRNQPDVKWKRECRRWNCFRGNHLVFSSMTWDIVNLTQFKTVSVQSKVRLVWVSCQPVNSLFLLNDFFCICCKQITGLSDAFPQTWKLPLQWLMLMLGLKTAANKPSESNLKTKYQE